MLCISLMLCICGLRFFYILYNIMLLCLNLPYVCFNVIKIIFFYNFRRLKHSIGKNTNVFPFVTLPNIYFRNK